MLSLVYMVNNLIPISTVNMAVVMSFTSLIFCCIPAGAGHGDEK